MSSKPAAKKTAAKKQPAKAAPAAKKTKPAKVVSKKAVAKKASNKPTAVRKKAATANKPVVKKMSASKDSPVKKTPAKKKAPARAASPPAKKATAKASKAAKPSSTPAKNVASAKAVAVAPQDAAPASTIIRKRTIDLDEIKLPKDYLPTPKEDYMSARQLRYFRNKLQNWREELITESQETLDHLRSEIRDVGDEAERASRESDNILELRTRDRYRKLLKKIDDALKRIEDGSYGYCEETGEDIGLGRLEARPIATLTVDAQERREMFQRQFRDDR